MSKGLFTKFSSFLLPIVFILLISFAIWTAILYVEKQAKLSVHKSLFTVLEISQEALLRWAYGQQHDLVDIANDDRIMDLTWAFLTTLESEKRLQLNQKFQHYMADRVAQYGDQNYWLIDPEGVNIASKSHVDLGVSNILTYLKKQDFNRILTGENVFIAPINYPVSLPTQHLLDPVLTREEPTAFVGVPIFGDNGEVLAALVLGFDPLVHFTRITELGRMGNTGETYAFDSNALLLTKSRFTQNLKLLGMLGDSKMAMLSLRITDPGVDLTQGLNATLAEDDRPLTLMAERALKDDRHPYYDAYPDYRGVPVMGAWLWNDELGIGLATEIDEQEALEGYHVTRFVFLCVLGVIVLLTLGLAYLPLWFKEKERIALAHHKNSLEKTVRHRTEQLEQANHKLKVLSELDPLTQIANRRLYNHTLIKEIAMANRTHEPISLLMIDIDNFKAYNDNYGHDMGDIILQEVAQIIRKSLTRMTDFVARFGGEEFVAIMPVTNEKGALFVANKIRESIEAAALEHLHSDVMPVITVSIGCATLEGTHLKKETLFQQADHALYLAKGKGRNQVVSYTKP